MSSTGRFFATLPVAFVAAAVVSVALERTLYRRLYRASDLDQVLLTIGIAFISVAVAAYIFGTTQQPIETPAYLRGSFDVLGLSLGELPAVPDRRRARRSRCCWSPALEYTRFGAQVRAAVDNQRMARGLGIDVDRTFASPSRSAPGLPVSAARWRSRSSASIRIFRLHLSRLCADRRLGRRARLDRRLVRRGDA